MSKLFLLSEEEIYKKFRPYVSNSDIDEIIEEMTETTEAKADNITNGDMVIATGMFRVVKELNDGIMVYVKPKGVFGQVLEYTKDWWDAPYKESER